MLYVRLLEDVALVEGQNGWEQPSPLSKEVPSNAKIVPDGTILISHGLDKFLHYTIPSIPSIKQQDAGFEFKSLYCAKEELGTLSHNTGEVYFPASAAGWNSSFSWFPIGRGCPDGKHPRKNERLYTLKPGETLEDYPQFASRASQLAWLEERRASWFPEQESKIIRYFSESRLLACKTLDEFCLLLKIHPAELLFTEEVSDPGAAFRRQGFSLEMSEEEAYEKGRGLYHGFSWAFVKKQLQARRLETQRWESPVVWVKAQKVEKRGKRQQEFTKKWQRSFSFVISTDIDTKESFISVQ